MYPYLMEFFKNVKFELKISALNDFIYDYEIVCRILLKFSK